VFKQQLSPLWIVILIAIALVLIAGFYFLFMGRNEATQESPTITNDPYASQYAAPPVKGSPEGGGVAPQ